MFCKNKESIQEVLEESTAKKKEIYFEDIEDEQYELFASEHHLPKVPYLPFSTNDNGPPTATNTCIMCRNFVLMYSFCQQFEKAVPPRSPACETHFISTLTQYIQPSDVKD